MAVRFRAEIVPVAVLVVAGLVGGFVSAHDTSADALTVPKLSGDSKE